MQSMMNAGMNKLDFAKELGVEKELKRLTDGDGAGLVQFMMTDDYKQINAYQEFLIKARKEAQKAQKVQALKQESQEVHVQAELVDFQELVPVAPLNVVLLALAPAAGMNKSRLTHQAKIYAPGVQAVRWQCYVKD